MQTYGDVSYSNYSTLLLAPQSYGHVIMENAFSPSSRVSEVLTVSIVFKSLQSKVSTDTQGNVLALRPYKIKVIYFQHNNCTE
jgi:hypothetical protein